MASASSIRAGGAFVEIFAKDGKFHQAMKRVENRLRATGAAMQKVGTGLALGGAAIGLPMVLAAKKAATFEDALLNARASAGLTAKEMEKVKQKSLELSKAGVGGPTEIANAFTALIKAGMPLEQALNGAAEAVVKFSSNSGVEATQAAEVASDAMNVFGESTQRATDILKAAADSSSTDIPQMVEAFSNVGAVAKDANQSMDTVSQALAILANNMVKGGDAGTALKTTMLRLATGADSAAEGLEMVGLSTDSFRDATGKMLPLGRQMDILRDKLDKLGAGDRAKVMYKIFGSYGLKAATILMKDGSAGFEKMAQAMGQAGTNAEAFDQRMGGISGSFKRITDAVERVAIAFTTSLGPSLAIATRFITGLLDGVTWFLTAFPTFGKIAAGAAAGLVVLGTASIVGGVALKVLATGVSVVTAALAALATPVGLAVATITAGLALIVVAGRQLSPAFKRETDAMMAAIGRADFSAAGALAMANLRIVLEQGWDKITDITQSATDGLASAFSFMWDKATEGLDRFMGLFGSDIYSLQSKFEKLSLYFKAAFDWRFASNGLKKALADVDARIAKERSRNPTADSRADARKESRTEAADQRAKAREEKKARDEAELEDLRKKRDEARKRALGEETKAEDKAAEEVKRPAASDAGGSMSLPSEGSADSKSKDGASTLGTFSASIASQMGVGPQLNAAERTADATEKIAENTGMMAADARANGQGGGVITVPPVPDNLASGVEASAQVASPDKLAASAEAQLSVLEKIAASMSEQTGFLKAIAAGIKSSGLAFS
jgi:TP901 family phage tail tape measure protein